MITSLPPKPLLLQVTRCLPAQVAGMHSSVKGEELANPGKLFCSTKYGEELRRVPSESHKKTLSGSMLMLLLIQHSAAPQLVGI